MAGTTDADGDAVVLTVTAVTQDEPLNGVGDGDTGPDAQRGATADTVLVRAERQGPSDGRVYRIYDDAAALAWANLARFANHPDATGRRDADGNPLPARRMLFRGVMTQQAACEQKPSRRVECARFDTDNSPQEGWQQLHARLQENLLTSQPANPRIVTDIRFYDSEQ